jgi:hypothetical protein
MFQRLPPSPGQPTADRTIKKTTGIKSIHVAVVEVPVAYNDSSMYRGETPQLSPSHVPRY